ncbi:hypothetical protein BCR33DRAFT_746123 [Rhizoclosmatium globosum]|uniref:Uncharacterized protein n=1 Tax=Rhizoclosmatium globosum TaxID=329046 RepID=A0A1Y2AXJ3_9FUNG|nr:hypothetical protein BCR33DRAFT_746123 [Rhizoclosmatium globosum]|eukprot:ORY27291.1 hypothetical protein BCR33DRAFT_746123 [Rhizoclosmatium globosum]
MSYLEQMRVEMKIQTPYRLQLTLLNDVAYNEGPRTNIPTPTLGIPVPTPPMSLASSRPNSAHEFDTLFNDTSRKENPRPVNRKLRKRERISKSANHTPPSLYNSTSQLYL